MIYLISHEEIEQLDGDGAQIELTESANLSFAPGSWITQEALLQLRQAHRAPKALVEVSELPVFYGPLETPYRDQYASALTALCLARPDGQTIRGISYLPRYDEYWFSRDLGRCFRYGCRGEPQHFWRILGHAGDVDWLRGYWGEAYGFAEWLARWIPDVGTGVSGSSHKP
jgi:hypothetical protein